MVEMLNRDVVPVVPEQGSLGASGDLAPLACLALPVIGHGESWSGTTVGARARCLRAVPGSHRSTLESKEGLALVNGTQGMLSIGVLALLRAERLARTADVVAAMTIEAALGTDAPFDERLQRLRPHPGQAASAANLRRAAGTTRRSASRIATARISCRTRTRSAARRRCTAPPGIRPRTSAGCWDRGERGQRQPDRPSRRRRGRSGGNFHGMPVAVALDALALSLVSIASISDRRLYRLLDVKNSNGSRPSLSRRAVSTAASCSCSTRGLARERVQVARPSRVGRFDPVERRPGGPREHGHDRCPPRARVVDNAETVLALEALGAAQALISVRRSSPARRHGGGTRRSAIACRSSSTTVSSAPTSTPPWSSSARRPRAAAEVAVGPSDRRRDGPRSRGPRLRHRRCDPGRRPRAPHRSTPPRPGRAPADTAPPRNAGAVEQHDVGAEPFPEEPQSFVRSRATHAGFAVTAVAPRAASSRTAGPASRSPRPCAHRRGPGVKSVATASARPLPRALPPGGVPAPRNNVDVGSNTAVVSSTLRGRRAFAEHRLRWSALRAPSRTAASAAPLGPELVGVDPQRQTARAAAPQRPRGPRA